MGRPSVCYWKNQHVVSRQQEISSLQFQLNCQNSINTPSVGAHLQGCTCRLHTFSVLDTVLWTGRWCIALWLEDTGAMNAFNLCSFYGAGTEVWHFSVVVRLRYEVEYIFNINIASKTCCVNIYSSEGMSSLPEHRYSTGTWQCNAEQEWILCCWLVLFGCFN